MPFSATVPEEVPVVRIRAGQTIPEEPFRSLWDARELIFILAKREVTLRYQHSVAGIGWAILQPFLTVVVLSVFQMLLGRKSTNGIPYPLYAAVAMVPWIFMVHALNQASHCLLSNSGVINKVHFPRLVLPIASVMGAAVDFALGLLLPPALMLYYRVAPGVSVLMLPVFALQVILLALGAGIWLGLLNAHFRDTANALPFITQLWFFLTPIAYTTDLIADRWRLVAGLNPMLGILEGVRWALLGSASPHLALWNAMSWLFIAVLLSTGLMAFLRGENSLADII